MNTKKKHASGDYRSEVMRARLLDAHHIAHVACIGFVMGVKFLGPAKHFFIERVGHKSVGGHGNALVHFGANDDALSFFSLSAL